MIDPAVRHHVRMVDVLLDEVGAGKCSVNSGPLRKWPSASVRRGWCYADDAQTRSPQCHLAKFAGPEYRAHDARCGSRSRPSIPLHSHETLARSV